MRLTLYTIPGSHPAIGARLMLRHKKLDFREARLTSGLHAARLRLAGFDAGTVPALRTPDRRVQGSIAIARFLESLRPDPPLYPRDPAARRHVQAAEAWGEQELQGVPRRILRYALVTDRNVRRALARINGLPAPSLAAIVMRPLAVYFARVSGATRETVVRDLDALPSLLDDVDALIRDGAIGIERPDAASFQIAPSLRLLMEIGALRPLFDGRPAARLATALLPEYPDEVPDVVLPATGKPASFQAFIPTV